MPFLTSGSAVIVALLGLLPSTRIPTPGVIYSFYFILSSLDVYNVVVVVFNIVLHVDKREKAGKLLLIFRAFISLKAMKYCDIFIHLCSYIYRNCTSGSHLLKYLSFGPANFWISLFSI